MGKKFLDWYLKPKSSTRNCNWSLFPYSKMRLTLASLEDPRGLFSFKIKSESCARPILKIPFSRVFCSVEGKIVLIEVLLIAWCTTNCLKKKRVNWIELNCMFESKKELRFEFWILKTWICNGWIETKCSRNCHCCFKILDAEGSIEQCYLPHSKKKKKSCLASRFLQIEY